MKNDKLSGSDKQSYYTVFQSNFNVSLSDVSKEAILNEPGNLTYHLETTFFYLNIAAKLYATIIIRSMFIPIWVNILQYLFQHIII